ncbi:MAG: tryptophan synthase subunit alpha [Bacteroidota bacterium]
MNRLGTHLSILQEKGEKALTLFLTAGFPKLNSTPSLVLMLEKAGADIIELGMPFSDPLADGPIIQESSAIALNNGMTLEHVLENVREIRKTSEIPIVLMGYVNPILAYGLDKFFVDASHAGVDGIILPEVPLEESARFAALIDSAGLANIMLVAPTTPVERVQRIDEVSSGFLYCVSMTGVTGMKRSGGNNGFIKHVKSNAKRNPVLVGFGISSLADARMYARDSDGVIVGSALIKRLLAGETKSSITQWVQRMKSEMG